MAGPGNPGDSGDARRTRVGAVSGGYMLPGGRLFRDKGKLVGYLRDNPGYVYKNRFLLQQSLGDETLGLAGYHVLKNSDRMFQYNGVPGRSTKVLRAWTTDPKEEKALSTNADKVKVTRVAPSKEKATVIPQGPKPKPDKPTPTTGPPTATSEAYKPVASVNRSAAIPTKTKPKTRAEQGIDPNANLLATAIKRLLGLDPSGGYTPLDAKALLAGLDADTATQTRLINSNIAGLDRIRDDNARRVDDMFATIGGQVERARQRGADMTGALGQSLAGGNAAILASIGGEAAPGAGPAAAVGQAGQNTLAAIGSADAQFLSDMGPLLQAEAGTIKADQLSQINAMRKEYMDQLQQVGSTNNSERAKLALQIAQANNEAGQQRFQNSASVAETLAGLAMSGIKLTQSQQQAIAALAQKSQAMALGQANKDRQYGLDVAKLVAGSANDQADASAAAAKASDQKVARATAAVRKYIDPSSYPLYKPGKYAPPGMVKDILNVYRSEGADLTDPRVRKAVVGAIKQYGVDVDPQWVNGWR